VGEELAILVRAHAAFRAHDLDATLAALDEHARRFPHGVLAEERSSQRVLALCAAGRSTEARAAAERFLRDYPESPMASRVRGACANDNH
jgi:outer membrane protein assembly factor BamD (BamD/ComL family)